MKTLEIIITILVCCLIAVFATKQSVSYKNKSDSEKLIFQELKKKYNSDGYDLVLETYKENAHLINDALNSIKKTYLD